MDRGPAAAPVSRRPLTWGDPQPRRLVVGIGELAVSAVPGELIVTHALGSCVAVCIWDPAAHVAGLLHFLLPDSRLNAERARQQPGAFADTGIPLLFETASRLGARPNRCSVRLIGGAAVSGAPGQAGGFDIGRRNTLAARAVLWRSGVLISQELVGGSDVRTVRIETTGGVIQVTTAGEVVADL